MTTLYRLNIEDSRQGPQDLYVLGQPGLEPLLRGLVIGASSVAEALQRLHEHGLHPVEPVDICASLCRPGWEGAYVRIPDDAPHEYAGQVLKVVQAADGLPALQDPKTGSLLMADDMPWRAGKTPGLSGGLITLEDWPREQVPLGPVDVPQEQFASAQQRDEMIRALILAGYAIVQEGGTDEGLRAVAGA